MADHAGWAVLMTVASDGTLLDRRRVELVDDALPKLPYHHDAQGLPIDEAVALIARVRLSAETHAAACLDALTAAVPIKIAGIAIRACPPLPDTDAERISDYRSQNVADTVMYRAALAQAAEARGWAVHWYEAKRVFDEAARVLRLETIDKFLKKTGDALGPPWRKDHRTAMAAAIAATPER
ncbi:MAG: hypothetical protein M5R36_04735 [Deltaproteobacteria bacterium]|nr:hypothetical protein [Deltaproteobacteria bacterium]